VSSDKPVGVLQAIAAGVGLLVFVAGVGLADLIDATRFAGQQAREAMEAMREYPDDDEGE
jgi:hypothetical protein